MDRFAFPIGMLITLMAMGALFLQLVYVAIEVWKEHRANDQKIGR